MPASKPSHRLRNMLLAAAAFLLVGGGALALVLLPRLTATYTAPDPFIGVTSEPFTGEVTEADVIEIEDRLRAVGLADSGYLFSTGVQTHLERLRSRAVSPDTLRAYADNLALLTSISTAYGQPIPVTFWDVRSQEMIENNLSEYDVAQAIAGPDSPYLALLARAFNRLYDFKQGEANGDAGTAVTVAMDIFDMTVDYYEAVTDFEIGSLDANRARLVGQGIVGVWQQVLFSTTRTNPINGRPMFSHSIFGRFSITSMWRYHTGINASIGEIWGISGFAERYVGDPANDNQVEHLSISTTLQLVLDNPVAILNAVELRDVLARRESALHALADSNINTLVGRDFLPRFLRDYHGGIAYLRCALSSESTASC